MSSDAIGAAGATGPRAPAGGRASLSERRRPGGQPLSCRPPAAERVVMDELRRAPAGQQPLCLVNHRVRAAHIDLPARAAGPLPDDGGQHAAHAGEVRVGGDDGNHGQRRIGRLHGPQRGHVIEVFGAPCADEQADPRAAAGALGRRDHFLDDRLDRRQAAPSRDAHQVPLLVSGSGQVPARRRRAAPCHRPGNGARASCSPGRRGPRARADPAARPARGALAMEKFRQARGHRATWTGRYWPAR